MKRIFVLLVSLLMLCSLAACAADPADSTGSTAGSTASQITVQELEGKLQEQAAWAVSGRVDHTREDGKPRLYAQVQNTSDAAISSVRVAFAAWDQDGKPVSMRTTEQAVASHIREVNFPQLTLAAGKTGTTSGYQVSAEHTNIAHVKVCVVAWTDAEGERIENPYYDTWRKLHFGQNLDIG